VTLNRSETEERKKRAAEEIKPILYKIKAGEMILREGERVTEIPMLKLKALQSQMEEEDVLSSSAGAALLIISLLVSIFVLYRPRIGGTIGEQNKNLLLLTLVLVTFFFIAQLGAFLNESLATRHSTELVANSMVYGIPLAAGAMIVCLFLGFELAMGFALVLAICVTIVLQLNFNLFLYFLINGAMAAYWIRDCRERKVFIKAGAKLGMLNIVLASAVEIYSGEFSSSKLLWDWSFAFMGGIGAGIVTAGIIPLVEIAFDYTTDIKLLELANLDQPILRNLMMEAPGTYHHSVIVGSMVEAAAAEIGANPLLAKVCGYYHDIGKIKKPMYFIENQTDGRNKHDKLAPSMSSLILVAHVKDGIDIARKHKLGQVIIEAIQQHHGTSLITYFYDKAIQQKGEDAVKIDNFRYPGPRPQTREIALVMLADMVEAASRTLANPTPSRIQGLVQNLVNKVFSDGQLDNCELTLKDLHKIAKSFNKILNAIHHHRVEYPEKLSSKHEKIKNGSLDRQQAKKIQDIAKENPEKSPGHLRRLGQS
jgi:putative nucleotidyltransferase with HDIG domain